MARDLVIGSSEDQGRPRVGNSPRDRMVRKMAWIGRVAAEGLSAAI
jgi:hypothetical protein